MRTTSIALAAHLAGGAHTLATCWLVTRTDAQVFGFTSHDEALEFEGVLFMAATGMDRSTIETRDGLAVGNADALGFLDSDAITEDDLRAGVWDHAEIRIFEVNWADLTQGSLKHMRGWLGEVAVKDQKYSVELRGLAAALNAKIGELVQPACQAELGDTRCKMVLTDYTTTGEVTSVVSDRIFDTDLSGATVRLTPTTTGAPPADYFGKLTWLTGANAGLSMEVRSNDTAVRVELQLPMTRTVEAGDTFSIVVRCPKSREVCFSRFGNVVNFRGFPDLPGVDKTMRIGGQ